MTTRETLNGTSWPQLSTELKLEILWYLLVVDVGEEEREVTPVKHLGLDVLPDPAPYGIDGYKHREAMKKTLGPLIATGNREVAALAQEVYYGSSFFIIECRGTSISGPNLSKAGLIRKLLVVVERFKIPTGVRCSHTNNARCVGLIGSQNPTLFKLRLHQPVNCKTHGRSIEQWGNPTGWSAWQLRFNRLDHLNFRFVFLQENISNDCIHTDCYEDFMRHVAIGLAARTISFRFYPYSQAHWNGRLQPTLPDVSGVIRHRCICAQKLERAFHRLIERKE
ncbi:hypothetical protein P171DRAFT_440447 [Karstenula rhodostoma CBS 690.94]|uniref:Uncharacterized protein n=1 Tax=Karstenula rhodostoma CBS 690.94 TaxID=1392251 RepID=A0A9P4PTQ6_9PLEO|nr:hypothetical protein P171DRAFT_440447 [Karstenula rhodostoma CBS 690.94]